MPLWLVVLIGVAVVGVAVAVVSARPAMLTAVGGVMMLVEARRMFAGW